MGDKLILNQIAVLEKTYFTERWKCIIGHYKFWLFVFLVQTSESLITRLFKDCEDLWELDELTIWLSMGNEPKTEDSGL